MATDSSLSESWSPGIPEGKPVYVVGGVTQPGASPHLRQPHALSFLCSASPLCFPNEASLLSAFMFSLHEREFVLLHPPNYYLVEVLCKVLTGLHLPPTLGFLASLYADAVLSVLY